MRWVSVGTRTMGAVLVVKKTMRTVPEESQMLSECWSHSDRGKANGGLTLYYCLLRSFCKPVPKITSSNLNLVNLRLFQLP